jgi:Cdc6-like AAA superfamily ATPase
MLAELQHLMYQSRDQDIYGTPGSGKTYTIKNILKKE